MLPLPSADKVKTFDTDKDGLNPNAKTFSRKDAKSQRKSSPIFGLTQDSKASDVLCALCLCPRYGNSRVRLSVALFLAIARDALFVDLGRYIIVDLER